MSTPTPSRVEYDFPLDRFQLDAIAHLDAGRSVLVAAPTGSGKTVVAEHAVAEALALGQRAFYTTPIKALSNQKFRDFVARHGAKNVGLLTGDNSINGDAPLVVMTTEVLRNMIYAGSRALDGLRYVVLDEVHYLEDAYRGPVWEEVIIHLPVDVRLVCLSATVSNANEVADWIETVRGPTAVVVETTRPVELVNLYAVGDKTSERIHVIPTLVDGRPNPEGSRFDANGPRARPQGRGGRPRRPFYTPSRLEMVERLKDDGQLPAIYFIFSRAACDDAVRSCLAAGVRLTDRDERERIRAHVEARMAPLSDADLAVLGYDTWLEGLQAGVAAHHAGMVPPFKETVEELFTEGLVRLVFATETLALGINMPARSVVIEKLTKFTGDHHEFLTSGQYTQLTGRAGRRGIDTVGYATVLWSPFVTFQQVADLAASRTFVLRSSFRPTYNMAANLVRRYERDHAHRLLNLSFAQYQADRAVVRIEKRLARRREEAAQLAEKLGDRARVEAARARADAAATRRRREAEPGLGDALSRLKPGDVLTDDDGNRAAVVSVAYRKGGNVKVRVVDTHGRVHAFGSDDLAGAPDVVGSIDLPSPYAPTSRGFQREVAHRLRQAKVSRSATTGTRRRGAGARPRSAAERAAWRTLEQLERVEADIADLEHRARHRSATLARRFDDVLAVLEHWGYVRDWELTERGERLVRIYHESDLAIAEAIALGIFDDVDPAALAGLASCFTYEHRSAEPPPPTWYPTRDVRERVDRLRALVEELNGLEAQRRLPVTRAIDPTFLPLAHAWAAGEPLDSVLEEEELSGGDFVRNIRQLIDLLRQIADAADQPATAAAARAASEALQRGVVAASTRVDTGDDDLADHVADHVVVPHAPVVGTERGPGELRETAKQRETGEQGERS